eukprot:ANDGO_04680.mRNA.1 hypothetical protein
MELLFSGVSKLVDLSIEGAIRYIKEWREERKYWRSGVLQDVDGILSLCDSLDIICNRAIVLAAMIPSDMVGSNGVAQDFIETISAVNTWVGEVIEYVRSTVVPGLEDSQRPGKYASAEVKKFRLSVVQFIKEAKEKVGDLDSLMDKQGKLLSTSMEISMAASLHGIEAALVRNAAATSEQMAVFMHDLSEICKARFCEPFDTNSSSFSSPSANASAYGYYCAQQAQLKEEARLERLYEVFLDSRCAMALPQCLRVRTEDFAQSAQKKGVGKDPYFLHELIVNVPISRYAQGEDDGGADGCGAQVGCFDYFLRLMAAPDAFRVMLFGGPGFGKSSTVRILSAICFITGSHRCGPTGMNAGAFARLNPAMDPQEVLQSILRRIGKSALEATPDHDGLVARRTVISLACKQVDAALRSAGTVDVPRYDIVRNLVANRMVDEGRASELPSDRAGLRSFLDRYFCNHPSLLILDGFDEIPSDRRDECKDAIQVFLQNFPCMSCIVTCRPVVLRDDDAVQSFVRDLRFTPVELHELHDASLLRQYATALLCKVYNVGEKDSATPSDAISAFLGDIEDTIQESSLSRGFFHVAMVTNLVVSGQRRCRSKPEIFYQYVQSIVDREALKIKDAVTMPGGTGSDEGRSSASMSSFVPNSESLTKIIRVFHDCCGALLTLLRLLTGDTVKFFFKEEGLGFNVTERMMHHAVRSILGDRCCDVNVQAIVDICEQQFRLLVPRDSETIQFCIDAFRDYFAADFLMHFAHSASDTNCFSASNLQDPSGIRAVFREIARSSLTHDLFLFLFGGAVFQMVCRNPTTMVQILDENNDAQALSFSGCFATYRLLQALHASLPTKICEPLQMVLVAALAEDRCTSSVVLCFPFALHGFAITAVPASFPAPLPPQLESEKFSSESVGHVLSRILRQSMLVRGDDGSLRNSWIAHPKTQELFEEVVNASGRLSSSQVRQLLGASVDVAKKSRFVVFAALAALCKFTENAFFDTFTFLRMNELRSVLQRWIPKDIVESFDVSVDAVSLVPTRSMLSFPAFVSCFGASVLHCTPLQEAGFSTERPVSDVELHEFQRVWGNLCS